MTSTDSRLGKQLLGAELQWHPTSGIRNPLVKCILVLLPLILGAIGGAWKVEATQGAENIKTAFLLWCALVTYLSVHMDMRNHNRGSTMGRVVFAAVCIILISIGAKEFPGIRDFYSRTPLAGFVSQSTWALLFLFAVSVSAIRLISSRDALWLGRKLVVRPVYEVYMTTVVVFFILQNSVSRRIPVPFNVAWTKYYLRGDRRGVGWARRVAWSIRAFTMVLLSQLTEMATLTHSLLEERGCFEVDHKDQYHWRNCGSSDVVAIVLLVLGACAPIVLLWA